METLVIIDFGSQYTQLIARCARELGVYSVIVPFEAGAGAVRSYDPKGIILSGGPSAVYDTGSPQLDPEVLSLGAPILGICYGLQLLAQAMGGSVASSPTREFGQATLVLTGESRLIDERFDGSTVWMSHGDYVTEVPEGFTVTARSGGIVCAMEDPALGLFGLQFHPEVVHTKYGREILTSFLEFCGFPRDWSPGSVIEQQVNAIKSAAGKHNVVSALSGGVDSSVASALVDRAIGKRQTCIFVDTGLLRKNEYEEVLAAYRAVGLNVKPVRAGRRFLAALKGVTDPEQKRKIIGSEFIRVFEHEAKHVKDTKFLVQGTLYPDVIESVSTGGPSVKIKSHHNVGGLPEKMKLKLIEPLRLLFKDEVRVIGRELGLPDSIVERQPFPGPGLAIRILGEVTPERVVILQQADAIVREVLDESPTRQDLWQFFAVLLPVKSVGVMGDGRTYEQVAAIRAIESTDGMTADWARLPYELLAAISSRIVSEVRGINRVVYDITSKPPGTIEWE